MITVSATLRFSHSFCVKCIGYNMKCIGAVMQSNLKGTNKHGVVTDTLCRVIRGYYMATVALPGISAR